jgi:hypothetical protein
VVTESYFEGEIQNTRRFRGGERHSTRAPSELYITNQLLAGAVKFDKIRIKRREHEGNREFN